MKLFLEQTLNGVQFGLTLMMVSAGLTLIFGIMNVINLAHGSLIMTGAFVAAEVSHRAGFFTGLIAGTVAAAVVGAVVEVLLIRRLYLRNHLDQVLATFALVLIANEAVQMIWGTSPQSLRVPKFLDRTITVMPGLPYPAYRLAVIAAGVAAMVLLYLLIGRTRVGMWIRAGTTHRDLVGAFGVNVPMLYTLVFAVGAALAGFGGVVAAPYLSVEAGIGDNFLIISFVVIVIGGIGSLKGAVVGSLIVGLIDTWARTYLPRLFSHFLDASSSATVAASVASASIYLAMVVVLMIRPNGLFGVDHG